MNGTLDPSNNAVLLPFIDVFSMALANVLSICWSTVINIIFTRYLLGRQQESRVGGVIEYIVLMVCNSEGICTISIES